MRFSFWEGGGCCGGESGGGMLVVLAMKRRRVSRGGRGGCIFGKGCELLGMGM